MYETSNTATVRKTPALHHPIASGGKPADFRVSHVKKAEKDAMKRAMRYGQGLFPHSLHNFMDYLASCHQDYRKAEVALYEKTFISNYQR